MLEYLFLAFRYIPLEWFIPYLVNSKDLDIYNQKILIQFHLTVSPLFICQNKNLTIFSPKAVEKCDLCTM